MTMNATQDWFMMTGDLIINLRSNKTGDSFRFRQQPNGKLIPRQGTFNKSNSIGLKQRKSSFEDEEEEVEENELSQTTEDAQSLDDDKHHQQKQPKKQKQKHQLLLSSAESTAAELSSGEEQQSINKVDATLSSAKKPTEESSISKSREEPVNPQALPDGKHSGTFKACSSSSTASSNSSSGNSSGVTGDEEEALTANSNSFSSSAELGQLSSPTSSFSASPVKLQQMSSPEGDDHLQEQQPPSSDPKNGPESLNSVNSRDQSTMTKQEYSPEQFCHYYDENYDSKQQQQIENVEENTYENIGETLANHHHQHNLNNHYQLSKSQESNLYNLIEDSKSFESLDSLVDSEDGSSSSSFSMIHLVDPPAQYSSSSKQPNSLNTNSNNAYIDAPSASRLAKRLFTLEGFQKGDVARHLSRNNEYSRAVAEEYLRLFDFSGLPLDEAVRRFLARFHLTGETTERERVLIYFSKRYWECNVGTSQSGNSSHLKKNSWNADYESVDAIHTLTCALMLLNTDLHEENIQRKMTCADFVLNLAGLNDGADFSTALLKSLYHSIKQKPLGWNDDDLEFERRNNHHRNGVFSKITTISKSITGGGSQASAYATLPRKFTMANTLSNSSNTLSSNNSNPFIEPPNPAAFAIEYKKGYIRRKCCYEANGRRTALGKRGWRLFYATLRDLVLYLHREENIGFRKSQLQASVANSIRIHHSIASVATDYPKKKFVFRLVTAESAEYLFETSDSRELQSWVDTLNTTAASLSAPALPSGVGSSNDCFKRELLPVSHTKLSLRDQLADQENKLLSLQRELEQLLEKSGRRSTNKIYHKDFVERENYLQHEVKRYRTYISCLKWKLKQQQKQQSEEQHLQSASSEFAGNKSVSDSSSHSSNIS